MRTKLYVPIGTDYDQLDGAYERFVGLHQREGIDVMRCSPKNGEYGLSIECPLDMLKPLVDEMQQEGWLE